MLGLYITLGVIGALFVVVLIYIVSVYNTLVKYRSNVKESFSTMDVCMKKRYDMIPNIVETVKGYAKHESQTLEAVINARNAVASAGTVEDRNQAENALGGTLKSLFALSESYPDLKANQNFINLQEQLKTIETEIANSRKYYNACVKVYNRKIEMFPSNIVAKMFKFEASKMFELDSEEERKNVKVEF